MKRFLAMLAAGLLLLPAAAVPTAAETDDDSGATAEITYTMEDVQNLQDYLLAKPLETDLTGKPYDLNGDGCWDVFDLSLMKREVQPNSAPAAQGDTIVIYFSRTGNTEKIASHLIDLTGADSFVIEAAVPYSDADIHYNDSDCRANQEQDDKTVRPEIASLPETLDGYETIFLGYPIWWGQEPRIIDTFLESFDFSEKTVIPFCTSASSGISTSEKNIAALVPIGEQLPGRRFGASASQADVKAWLDTLPLHKTETKLQLTIGETTLTASLEDNSSAMALISLLQEGSLTLDLHDYGDFEKVGDLPQALPRNDEQISVDYGDLILYQGNQFSIYYDQNTWSFTKLGHIDSITQEALRALLGDGNVTAVLSLQ